MRLLLTLIFCFASLGVEAAEPAKVEAETLAPVGSKPDDKKSVPAASEEDAEPVTPEQQAALICQTADIMREHVAGADYVAGVDAYGNPVAPADAVSQQVFDVPEEIEIPIAVDVMAALGVAGPPVEGKATVGTLTVLKGGQLLYNGQDITGSVEGYCRAHVQKTKDQKQ